jgi:ATP-binding cassette subfamily F protein uup
MDEPTNDLDVETLELLEELLMDYQGTLLLVSHDRAFLDNVVTRSLVFEGDGRIGEYVGGYSDWLRQKKAEDKTSRQGAVVQSAPAEKEKTKKPGKLSYKDQRELDALPAIIEGLEDEQSQLQETVSDTAFYQQPAEEISATLARLESIASELEMGYARWEGLEAQLNDQ